MTVLLDTHVYLFAAYDPSQLSIAARDLLVRPDVALLWSAASTWEIAIKIRLGRAELPPTALARLDEGLKTLGARVLPVRHAHALQVATLPDIHKDPFDRLLIAQALCERIPLVTNDAIIPRYPGISVRW